MSPFFKQTHLSSPLGPLLTLLPSPDGGGSRQALSLTHASFSPIARFSSSEILLEGGCVEPLSRLTTLPPFGGRSHAFLHRQGVETGGHTAAVQAPVELCDFQPTMLARLVVA